MIFHCHIPKTAGGTILSIMRSQYGEDLLAVPARGWEKVSPETAQRHEAISGHVPYLVPEERWGLDEVTTFTILRDPLKRAGSLYAYIHRRGRHHAAYNLVRSMTPQEFAERGPFDNCQTRMLASRHDFQWFDRKHPVQERDYALATQALDEMAFVGDVATFRQDIYRLADNLGWRGFVIPHINASLSKPKIEMTPEFKEKWRWDLALYQRHRVK